MVSKYHNKKITAPDGEIFDSMKEFLRWQELKMLERAGEISNLKRQVKFELLPSQPKIAGGIRAERPVAYIADFVYNEGGWKVVEDCKGMRTDVYILKRKLMRFVHGIEIREV